MHPVSNYYRLNVYVYGSQGEALAQVTVTAIICPAEVSLSQNTNTYTVWRAKTFWMAEPSGY